MAGSGPSYKRSTPQIIDNIGGFHFERTCWGCGMWDQCRCDPKLVTYRRPIWYLCVECKIERGELDEHGYPLR